MAMSIAAVMDGLGVRLATIPTLRVYDYPADSVSAPAAIVRFPEPVAYDLTAGRGTDRATFPVTVLVGKVSDRAARDALALYLNGTGARSIKAAVEGDKTLGGAAQSTRVIEASVANFRVGDADYLGATFDIDVIA
jgi:hypothetical protein